EQIVELQRVVAALRDEITRLKGGPGRPNPKPSGMERGTEPKPPGSCGERKRVRGGTRSKLAIDEERTVTLAPPRGSRLKGYTSFRKEETYYDEVTELLGWVGLGDRMWSLPPVLSGGEQQRVAIARAVIARPQILLADEPTGNVDPALAQRLLRMFIELNKSGTSVVIATHDIALMDQYDARRLVLHDGRSYVYE